MSKNIQAFTSYAKAYDTLYKEKKYDAECDFLESVFLRFGKKSLRNILDIGCGTGGHAIPLARRGYTVYGIDRSRAMIETAGKKSRDQGFTNQVYFKVGDIQKTDLRKKFDAAICMFAVLSYQTSNDQIFATLKNIRKHLKPNGLFVCDFWYGPAVLSQKPQERIKIINTGEKKIIRIAKPSLDTRTNVVTVAYHLIQIRGSMITEEIAEDHHMRYFFGPEIEFFLQQAKLKPMQFCAFPVLDSDIDEETWNVSLIARAI
ncbi:MAG: class I SAM-dependent methyltransferase [Thermodesulfovibrionales bacterium]|nr:class I SAM-dependent methyltransferase [Thermodesulfovibrionales bacterium]